MNAAPGVGSRRLLLRATATPLASIFGSGFLIIVPTLERGMGGAALLGIAVVVVAAWFVGMAIRHNVAVVEAMEDDGTIDPLTRRLERLSDAVIVVAYVVSVTLYLRILSQYVLSYADVAGDAAQQQLTTGFVVCIGLVGVVRGFEGLDLLDRVALSATLALASVLLALFLGDDGRSLLHGDLVLPPGTAPPFLETAALLGGIVITVQGFETVRYLRDEFPRETRIAAARWSQIVSGGIYLTFVALATPLMATARGATPDPTLLALAEHVAAFIGLPLVVIAILSQFSAAVADTVAAVGNLRTFGLDHLRGALPYVVSTLAAVALTWVTTLPELVAVASRAFAAYYAVQGVVAARTSRGVARRTGYSVIAVAMALVAAFARPVG